MVSPLRLAVALSAVSRPRPARSGSVSAARGAEPGESEGEPSAAETHDGLLKRRPRVFRRPVRDAWRRSRRGCALNRIRDDGARCRVSPERSLRSRRPGGRCSTLRTYSCRREALRPSGSALGGESGARSNAALRVWDGPSGFLWRESREKPDSDSDCGSRRPEFGDSRRVCLPRCGIHVADVGLRRSARGKRRVLKPVQDILLQAAGEPTVMRFGCIRYSRGCEMRAVERGVLRWLPQVVKRIQKEMNIDLVHAIWNGRLGAAHERGVSQRHGRDRTRPTRSP